MLGEFHNAHKINAASSESVLSKKHQSEPKTVLLLDVTWQQLI